MDFLDKYNMIVGSIVAILSGIFGVNWQLFVFFFIFTVLDWLTGWYKARYLKISNSVDGLKGLIRKLGDWVILIVGFSIPLIFQEIGHQLGIDLSFLQLIGWFTLASLMINEIRSILENLVESGYKVPQVLLKGMAVANKIIEQEETNEDKKI